MLPAADRGSFRANGLMAGGGNEARQDHALWCKRRSASSNAAAAKPDAPLFLYREVTSEGIRMFVPPVDFADGNTALQSLISAIQLGVRKHFKGAVSHLAIAPDVRMVDGGANTRQYLVIYDTVPGGTGYLKELMRSADGEDITAPEGIPGASRTRMALLDVFAKALEALDQCSCNRAPDRENGTPVDGCYRCIYRYHNSHDRKVVSRRTAQRLLGMILENCAQLQPIDTAANDGGLEKLWRDLDANPLLESDLERRFLKALVKPDKLAGQQGHATLRLRPAPVNGKRGYYLEAGALRWRVELQADLGKPFNVLLPSRPDFVFWPDNIPDERPIAVFADGWNYHKDKVAEDLAKRMALVKSGRFSVWSVNWADVEQASTGQDGAAAQVGPGVQVSSPQVTWQAVFGTNVDGVLPRLCEVQGLKGFEHFWRLSALQQLQMRLSGLLTHEQHRKLASVVAMATLAQPADEQAINRMKQTDLWQHLEGYGMTDCIPQGSRWACRSLWQVAQLAVVQSGQQFSHWLNGGSAVENEPWAMLLWQPAEEGQGDDDARRQQGWRQMWAVLNVLLPLDQLWAGAEPMALLGALQPLARQTGQPAPDPRWLAVLADALPEVHGWIEEMMQAGCSVPEVGHELEGVTQTVLAQAELAWPKHQVAVVMSDEDVVAFQSAGWKVHVFEDGQAPAALLDSVR